MGPAHYERVAIRSHIFNNDIEVFTDPSEIQGKKWRIEHINGKYYLVCILKIGDIYIAALGNINTLMLPLDMIDLGTNGAYLFTSESGHPLTNEKLVQDNQIDLNLGFQKYYISGNKNKYMIVGEKSSKGNFNLVALYLTMKSWKNFRLYKGSYPSSLYYLFFFYRVHY